METTTQRIIRATAVLLVSSNQAFAIEGLQISVQCSNVVLSWPSQDGETYIVQYRADLASTNPWTTLTNEMPPDLNANITVFAHSNIVQNPNCGESGSFAAMAFGGDSGADSMATAGASTPQEPLAMRADGSGSAVPVVIFPPGFDFTGYLIFDPSTAEWINGSGYSRASVFSSNGAQFDGPEPPGGDGAESTPATGFYSVIRNGAHIFGLTNETTLSGTVQLPIEAGYLEGSLTVLTLSRNNAVGNLPNRARSAAFTPLRAAPALPRTNTKP